MATIDYAFPAVDSSTVQTLASSGTVTAAQVASLKNSVNAAESQNFLQSINTADAASNNVLTYGVLLSRNTSLSALARDLTQQNQDVTNGLKDTYTRQAEINEWEAQNKLDTLFFLQLLFLFFTLMVFLLFLRRYGILPAQSVWITGAVFGILMVGVLWNRASYTANSRDNRYWNRRYLGLQDSGLSAKAATCQ
jgi:hypothetical protein